jgi:hypothetical protein
MAATPSHRRRCPPRPQAAQTRRRARARLHPRRCASAAAHSGRSDRRRRLPASQRRQPLLLRRHQHPSLRSEAEKARQRLTPQAACDPAGASAAAAAPATSLQSEAQTARQRPTPQMASQPARASAAAPATSRRAEAQAAQQRPPSRCRCDRRAWTRSRPRVRISRAQLSAARASRCHFPHKRRAC